MTQTTFYDRISLVCLILGGIIMAFAMGCCFHSAWLPMIAFFIVALVAWHFASLFAKFAIAASGRQK